MAENDAGAGCGCLCLILVVLIVIGSLGYRWYRAGLQAEVYRREGINMTTWEIMNGAKPAERTINLSK